MQHVITKPTFTIGNSPPIELVSASYCDGMTLFAPCCPRCGSHLCPVPPGQTLQCFCGYIGVSNDPSYYVEPCFIELDWLIYERDFSPLIAPMHLVSDLVALTFHVEQGGTPWTDICDGCKFSSHELASLSKAIPRDFIKLHFSASQIYWGKRTQNGEPSPVPLRLAT